MDKLIWEMKAAGEWVTVGPDNLDEAGNLSGYALKLKEQDRMDFRQTLQSAIGTGDSTGKVRVILDLGEDIDYSKYSK